MSKPILVVKVPHMNQEHFNIIGKQLQRNEELNKDYHVLTLQTPKEGSMEFECFNSPYKEEELIELRQLIDKINKEHEYTR